MSAPTPDEERAKAERDAFTECLRLLSTFSRSRREAIIRALAVFFEVSR